MVVSNYNTRKGTTAQGKSVTARLLVLGDKQVGKSATIVRFTTGRYIQEYSDASSDWLYRHPLGFDAKRNQSVAVELLEQKDIKFCNSGNFFVSSSNASTSQQSALQNKQTPHQSLASRVALDQQLANELHEKQEMLNKLHWADAYIVIYAINDTSTFNKAIKYLNLIANNINSPIHTDGHRLSCSSSCSSSSFASNGSTFFNRLSPSQPASAANRLSPSHLSSGANCNCNSSSTNFNKRPILLLGNKRDLERSGRQVSASDGRLLAMRHQTMFAELSIAESNRLIESFMGNLIEQIDQSSLHADNLCHGSQQQSDRRPLVPWQPTVEAALTQSSINLTAPIWASLVKSKPMVSTMVAQSSKVCNSKRETSDVYSLKPVALVAKSCEVGGNRKQAASCSLLKRNSTGQSSISTVSHPQAMRCTPINSSSSSNYQNRYKNLKSSFKRASMAIVSSKALTRNPPTKFGSQKRSSTTSSEQDSISEHHVTQLNANTDSQNVSDRFRRPLFKYRGRRTTVAFEDISAATNDNQKSTRAGRQLANSTLNHSKSSLNKTSAQGYDLARNTSARSSSSLSNSDTNYSSSLMLSEDLERTPAVVTQSARSTSAGSTSGCSSSQSSQTASLTLIRHNSNTTLSRASTSGGSHEDSGDEFSSNSIISKFNVATHHTRAESTGLGELLAKHHQISHSPPTNKKRYDLVKSVQSTLYNLTRSSNIAGQTPKRSFCSTLFRHTDPNAITMRH